MIYIPKQRAQHLLVWNNAPTRIRTPTHNRRLSPTRWIDLAEDKDQMQAVVHTL
jgi:hypothetical protein